MTGKPPTSPDVVNLARELPIFGHSGGIFDVGDGFFISIEEGSLLHIRITLRKQQNFQS